MSLTLLVWAGSLDSRERLPAQAQYTSIVCLASKIKRVFTGRSPSRELSGPAIPLLGDVTLPALVPRQLVCRTGEDSVVGRRSVADEGESRGAVMKRLGDPKRAIIRVRNSREVIR